VRGQQRSKAVDRHEELKKLAREHVERHLGDVCDGDDAAAIADEAWNLAFDAAFDAGASRKAARKVADEISKEFTR
jgi:hypothetical protein